MLQRRRWPILSILQSILQRPVRVGVSQILFFYPFQQLLVRVLLVARPVIHASGNVQLCSTVMQKLILAPDRCECARWREVFPTITHETQQAAQRKIPKIYDTGKSSSQAQEALLDVPQQLKFLLPSRHLHLHPNVHGQAMQKHTRYHGNS